MSLPIRCTLPSLLQFIEKDTFCHAFGIGASVPPMRVTRDDHTGNERKSVRLAAVSGGLRIYKYTGWKNGNNFAPTKKMYLHCKRGGYFWVRKYEYDAEKKR